MKKIKKLGKMMASLGINIVMPVADFTENIEDADNEENKEPKEAKSGEGEEVNSHDAEVLNSFMAAVRLCLICHRQVLLTSCRICYLCQDPICTFCEESCRFPEGIYCPTCRPMMKVTKAPCPKCNLLVDRDSMLCCIRCAKTLCPNCHEKMTKTCLTCTGKCCEDCLKRCSKCQDFVCTNCVKRCNICRNPCCNKCSASCKNCTWKLHAEGVNTKFVQIKSGGLCAEALDQRSEDAFILRGLANFMTGVYAYEVLLKQVQRDCSGFGFGLSTLENYKDYIDGKIGKKDFGKVLIGITANNAGMSHAINGPRVQLKPGQTFKVIVNRDTQKMEITGPGTKLVADLMPEVVYIPVFTRCHGGFAVYINPVHDFN